MPDLVSAPHAHVFVHLLIPNVWACDCGYQRTDESMPTRRQPELTATPNL